MRDYPIGRNGIRQLDAGRNGRRDSSPQQRGRRCQHTYADVSDAYGTYEQCTKFGCGHVRGFAYGMGFR